MSNLETKEILLAIDNIVSNQLNRLEQKVDSRFDIIEEKIKVIPQMQEDIKNMQEQIKVIPGMQEDIKNIQEQIKVIPQMQEDIKNIQEQIKVIPGMQSDIRKMQSNIEKMQEDIQELKDNYYDLYREMRNISRTVAKIEVEHGEKLAILFDAVTANNEKQEMLEKRLNKCEKRIENNENQIYFLNSKIQNM